MPELLVAGRKVNFTDAGAGEPVLLLHSASSSSAQWRALAEALKDRFRVLAVDLLGYGGTSAWDDRELRSEDEFVLLRALIAHAGAPVHLVGHSYGGQLALKLALLEEASFRSLTLIEPVAFWLLRLVREDALYAEIRAIADPFVAAFEQGMDPEPAVSAYVEYWNGPGSWARTPDNIRSYVLKTAGKVRREWATCFECDIPLRDIARLRLPTLLVCGERTNATTRRIAELLHGALPDAGFAWIPDARHMSPITHPDPVNAAIRGHLGRA